MNNPDSKALRKSVYVIESIKQKNTVPKNLNGPPNTAPFEKNFEEMQIYNQIIICNIRDSGYYTREVACIVYFNEYDFSMYLISMQSIPYLSAYLQEDFEGTT